MTTIVTPPASAAVHGRAIASAIAISPARRDQLARGAQIGVPSDPSPSAAAWSAAYEVAVAMGASLDDARAIADAASSRF